MKRLAFLIIIIITSNLVSFGQFVNVPKLDSLLNLLASKDLAMGSLTIAKNGIVQYQKAIGCSYIDREKKLNADINTKYRIGSATKMFTAVMIFQLIEEGKLRLDQKLNTYFPTLPNADKITIQHALP